VHSTKTEQCLASHTLRFNANKAKPTSSSFTDRKHLTAQQKAEATNQPHLMIRDKEEKRRDEYVDYGVQRLPPAGSSAMSSRSLPLSGSTSLGSISVQYRSILAPPRPVRPGMSYVYTPSGYAYSVAMSYMASPSVSSMASLSSHMSVSMASPSLIPTPPPSFALTAVPSAMPSSSVSPTVLSVPVVEFTSTLALNGLSGSILDLPSQMALVVTTAWAMNISAKYVTYGSNVDLRGGMGADKSSGRGRRLLISLSKSIFSAMMGTTSVTMTTKIPLQGPYASYASNPTALYTLTTSNLLTVINSPSGAFSSYLHQVASQLGASTIANVSCTGAVVSTMSIILPPGTPTTSPTARPTPAPTYPFQLPSAPSMPLAPISTIQMGSYSGLSEGAVAGIGIGCVIGVGLIALGVYYYLEGYKAVKKRKTYISVNGTEEKDDILLSSQVASYPRPKPKAKAASGNRFSNKNRQVVAGADSGGFAALV
jgi:hypothetical protein